MEAVIAGLAAQRGLTPHSSRAPTAKCQARSGGTGYIFAQPGPGIFLLVARLARTLGITGVTLSSDAHNSQSVAPDGVMYNDAIRAIHVWLEAVRDFDRLIGISAAVVHGEHLLLSAG